jgi:hypothetical protein
MLNRKVAAGTAHAGHDFIGDQENAVCGTNFCHPLQISIWRYCGA